MSAGTRVSSAVRGLLAGSLVVLLSSTTLGQPAANGNGRQGTRAQQQPPALTLHQPAPAVRGRGDAVIEYELEKPVDAIAIEFLDAGGAVIRRVTGSDAEDATIKEADARAEAAHGAIGPDAPTRVAGTNRYRWDLRHEGATPIQGLALSDPQSNAGPLALPGTYQVRVIAGSDRATRSLVVEMDPAQKGATASDLQAQFDLALRVRDATNRANQAVIRIRGYKAQIAERVPKARSPVIGLAADATSRALSEVERDICVVPTRQDQKPAAGPNKLLDRLAALRRGIETGDARPTDAARAEFVQLSEELEGLLKRLAGIEANHLTAFNQLLTNGGLEPIALSAPTKP